MKRLDLKVGFSCNNNCRFCVAADKRVKGNKTTEQIKKDLEMGIKDKCSGVVFTGGEPTIRKDILELVAYAKQLDYKTIQIQTNGRMLAYKDFCEKLIEAGATEFSPALHGHIPKLHDFLTSSQGAFNQITQGLKNLQELGAYIITNTVITKPNYRYLPEIVQLLLKYNIAQFQLAFVHAQGNAYNNFDSIVPLKSIVKPFVHKALDIGIQAGVKCMVEAYPFCFMQGYEKYCSEFYIPPTEIREINSFTPDFEKTRKEEGKTKGPQCKECKYDLICEGPWKEYPEKRGWGEFVPVGGGKITSRNIQKLNYTKNYGTKKFASTISLYKINSPKFIALKNGLKHLVKFMGYFEDYVYLKKICGGFSFYVDFIETGHNGVYDIYVSDSKEIIEKIKDIFSPMSKYDIFYKEKYLGLLLGYPSCCVKNFIKVYKKENKYPFNYFLHIVKNTKNVFDFRLNSFTKPNTLIFHYPCSNNCRRSVKKVNELLHIIKNTDNKYYTTLIELLHRPVVYWDETNFIIFKGNVVENKIIYNEAIFSRRDTFDAKDNPNFIYEYKNFLERGNVVEVNENNIKILRNNRLLYTIKKKHKYGGILLCWEDLQREKGKRNK